jgi:hypothetical protein
MKASCPWKSRALGTTAWHVDSHISPIAHDIAQRLDAFKNRKYSPLTVFCFYVMIACLPLAFLPVAFKEAENRADRIYRIEKKKL